MLDRSLSIVFAGYHVGNGGFPRHCHEVWEAIYVCDGSVITDQDGQAIHLSPGMVLINPPGVVHSDTYVRPYHLIYLFVEGSALESSQRVLDDESNQPIRQVFEAVLREWGDNRPDRDVMLQALGCQLAILIGRANARTVETGLDARLVEAESILRSSIGEPIALNDLARRIGASRSWLHQAFSQAYGKSPREYLAQLRLEKALALLRHSSHTVAFIGLECGYASGSHLTHHVRQATGMSPSEIRKLG